MIRARTAAAAAAAAAVALAGATAGTASPKLQMGIVEHAGAYYDHPDELYPVLAELGAQLLRVNLNWGGRLGVARWRPSEFADPEDAAYDWRLYDTIVLRAQAHGVGVVFSIFGTPPWANGGRPPNRAPGAGTSLQGFAEAAATRYSGRYVRADGTRLPRVRHWIAWNEPNLGLGLVPQWRRVGGRWVPQSATDYARICNAIVDGNRAARVAGNRVACGVTAPRGNNNPRGKRPSVSPLAFMRAMKRAGARGFDAYAHHAYYGGPKETPSTPPPGRTAVSLGNIDTLVREVTRLWGGKRIWITEYGFQTNPPDTVFGVSPERQARHLTEAYEIARRHPRIDMMLWFLLRDEVRPEGWQSGLIDADGRRKPAFYAFRSLAR